MFTSLNRYRQFGPLVLRVVIGIIFLAHGLQKFGIVPGGNLVGVTSFFGTVGIPVPGFMAVVVALVEAVGGVALILGFGTRIAAILLSIVMLVAILVVKLPSGAGLIGANSFELDLALLAGLVALILMGSGEAALEDKILSPRFT